VSERRELPPLQGTAGVVPKLVVWKGIEDTTMNFHFGRKKKKTI